MLYTLHDLAGSQFLTAKSIDPFDDIRPFLKSKFEPSQKYRLLVDNFIDTDIAEWVVANFPKVAVQPYTTTFYRFLRETSQSFLTKFPVLDASLLATDFDCIRIDEKDLESKNIIQNLIENSFGVSFKATENGTKEISANESKIQKLQSKFDTLWNQPKNHKYLVKTKTGEIVGTFTLTKVEFEVQLSAVAGRSNLQNTFTGKKLPILCAFVVQQFLQEKDFAKCDILTFSNSKEPVAQMYSSLGFEENPERCGVILGG